MKSLHKCSRVLGWAFCVAVFVGAPGGAAHAGYKLVWSDDFDGKVLDEDKWSHDVMAGSATGNRELEYYTAAPQNSRVENGCLVIEARKEPYEKCDYTSARLHTKHKGDFLYGRIQARIKLPSGQGLWPAFWMLPSDEAYGKWAASGEIDIMEAINFRPSQITGSIHFGGVWPRHKYLNGRYSAATPKGPVDFSQDFHVYTVEWTPFEFRWYVDGNLYASQDDWVCDEAPFPAPFDKRFHLVLNLAVGGHWPGPPDDTTRWPQRMLVDWVRVYQTDNAPPTVKLVAPAANALLPPGQPIKIAAEVIDPDNKTASVQFYAGMTLIGRDKTVPYVCEWRPQTGYYRLRARAIDREGFARSDSVYVAVGKEVLQEPYYGTPSAIPGRIEAEDFDKGIPGEAFKDYDSVNPENKYRTNQPVEVLACGEGGYKVGWMDKGEWLEYTVAVKESTTYDFVIRVSSDNGLGQVHIEMDGSNVTGELEVPNTGGWDVFRDIKAYAVALKAGVQTMRLYVGREGVNINYVNIVAAASSSAAKP